MAGEQVCHQAGLEIVKLADFVRKPLRILLHSREACDGFSDLGDIKSTDPMFQEVLLCQEGICATLSAMNLFLDKNVSEVPEHVLIERLLRNERPHVLVQKGRAG